jgi:TRAP transporter TAXI family solute receptor
MMKKWLMLLVAVLIMVPFVTACGGASEKPASSEKSTNSPGSEEAKPKAPVKFLKIASGPMGSGWYPITTLISEIYMDEFDGLNVSQLEGGSVSNLRTLEKGEDAQFSINYTSDFADAMNGRGNFEKPLENVAAIGALYPAFQTVATLADNQDINKVEDIVSKHVFIGPKGGGSIVGFWRVMEEYGITEETFNQNGGKISYGNYSDGASMLKDGIVDVFFGGGAPGVVSLKEIEVTKKIKVIPIDQEVLDRVKNKGYGMSGAMLPANTYDGQTEEVPLWTLESMLTVRKDFDEEFVYNMTKFFWENLNRFEEQLPTRAVYMTYDTVLSGLEESQLHPGALKFYKEVGAIK